MNKKALKTFGILGGILLAFAALFTVVYFSTFSSAEPRNYYLLDEKIKIDFGEKTTYSIKVIFPDGTNKIRKGQSSSFIFEPKELGKYSLEISLPNESKKIDFQVVDFIVNESLPVENSENPFDSYLRYQYVSNISEYSKEDNILVGKDVLWKKEFTTSTDKEFEFVVPKYASQIKLKNNGLEKFYAEKKGLAYSIFNLLGNGDNKSYISEVSTGLIELEYITPGPKKYEKEFSKNHKQVTIYDSNEVGYKNILAYTSFTDNVEIEKRNSIKIYWKQENKYIDFIARDINNNGFIDSLEWVVPHLSNQTFDIILINTAEHLSSSKEFISDITEAARYLDLNLTEPINEGDYIRVTFDQKLNSSKDITIYPLILSGDPIVEVFEFNSSVKLAEFRNLVGLNYNTIFLTNLIGEQDTFDLRVLGGAISLDQIVDPFAFPNATGNATWLQPQQCAGEDTVNTKTSFAGSCDGTYPAACGAGGDLLSCNDAQSETHTAQQSKWGGVRINVSNSTITNCNSVTDVDLCYEWWSSSASINDCDIGIDQSDNNWTNVTTTCPGTSANPGVTCVDITSYKTWTCSNFFGSSGNRSRIKSEAQKSTTGVAITITWDVLFFNVTYDTTAGGTLGVTLNSPDNNAIFRAAVNYNYTPLTPTVFSNCSLWDNSSGTFALRQENTTAITNSSFNFFNNINYSNTGPYLWNVRCCDASSCTFASSNRTVIIDNTAPNVNLVWPANNSNITNPFDLYQIFNVSDTLSAISNCSILIDGVSQQTDTSITEDTNQTFYQYLTNGIKIWQIACIDAVGNVGYSENRTINISIAPFVFTERLYETGIQNYSSQTAELYLNNSQDSTANTASFTIGSGSLVNIVNATTSFISNNGAIIPAGTTVSFSAGFTTSSNNVELTWKLYKVNYSGSYLLCQNGDDGAGGTPTTSPTSSNTTCFSSATRLLSSDKIMLVINAYNTAGSSRSITHAWDSPYSSYVDLNISTEGFLSTNISYPLIDPNIGIGSTFNATCIAVCNIGICRNTTIYIQQNTSSNIWTNINSSSGNLILAAGETNGHSLGNLSNTSQSTNFTLQGNTVSVNNLRCIAISTYDSVNGSNTTSVTVTSAGATAPQVNITSPANLTWWNSSSINLFYNVSDINDNLANSTLYLNNSVNQTNQSTLLNNQINNFTINGLADGYYNWTVNATDTTSLTGIGNETRFFYIDTLKPQINLTYPGNGSSFEVSTIVFNLTATDNLDSNLSCNLTIDSVLRHTNFGALNNTETSKTVTGLTIGTHYWNVTCIDNALNINASETRAFTVTDLPPIVILITSNLTWFNTSSLNLTYNASDNNGFLISDLYINGTYNQSNQSAIINHDYNNFSVNLQDGMYLWYVNVTDTGGFNSTNLTRTFYVDTQAPRINITSPNNLTSFNSSSVNFSFIIRDNMDSSLTCNLTVGSISDSNFAAANNTEITRTISGLTDWNKTWNVSCIDEATNYNISLNRIVNITEAPRINLVTANNSFFNSSAVNLTYTPSDNTNLSMCIIYLNGVANQSNQSVLLNGSQNNFSLNLQEGSYNWSVWCNDTYNLQNISETRYFTIDTQNMNITLSYPVAGQEIFESLINFSYTVVDNSDTLLDCNITVNNALVNSSTVSNATITNRTVNFISGGIKYWNVTCRDDSGNLQTSETRNFTLAFAPVVNLTSPNNATWYNLTSLNFSYYVGDDNDNLANSSLIINGQINNSNQTNLVNYGINNFTVTGLVDGRYNWTVNATDSTNLRRTGNETRIFYIDTQAPKVSLNLPTNSSTQTWNNITFNFTISDNLDTDLSCNLTVNGSSGLDEVTLSNINNGSTTVYHLSKQDGFYNWFILCADHAGNYNLSEERYFTVEAPPLINLTSPTSNSYFGINSITFNYTPLDVYGLFNCSLYLDGQLNSTDTTISANSPNNFLVNGITEGAHNWSIECYDAAPDLNRGNSSTITFFIDLTPPSIILNYPANNSGIYRNQSYLRLYFSFISNDTLDPNLVCNVSLDGIRNKTNVLVTSNIDYSDYISGVTLGDHNWSVACKDTANNTNSSQIYLFNYTYPDFLINTTLISLNNTQPKENEPVLINATIYNLGGADVNNTIVRFYNASPAIGGTQIGANQSINLSKNSLTYTSVVWSANVGSTDIYVEVDPLVLASGKFNEWNETNNNATKTSTVSGWQFLVGEINSGGEFQLADDASNDKLINWSLETFLRGNIYVADYESSVSWTNLKALGKTKTGTDSSNDFSETDTNLNMANFSDSVYITFTNSGTPKLTDNITIFNNLVYYVPIVNSTNNTNFSTGILWDGADSVNNEYDSSEDEDLVFISQVNLSKQGAYGEYDYEMRVPALLRQYKTTDTNSVSLYLELV